MAEKRFSWDSVHGASLPPVPYVKNDPLYFRLPHVLTERLPSSLAGAVTERISRLRLSPYETVEEIRFRADAPVSFTAGGRNVLTDLYLSGHDLNELLFRLCGGSVYAYEREIAQGFLTLPGGIRVGVAGQAAVEDGRVLGLRSVSGLCIRLPHTHDGIGGRLCRMIREEVMRGNARGILIYGPPGVGKTTVLRAAASLLASPPDPLRTVVVDTRCELSFGLKDNGGCLDVLSGYPRPLGVEIAVRTLNAQVIVCDEIGDAKEAFALTAAHRGGVPLVCSAHAGSCRELLKRPGIRMLHDADLFASYVGLMRDGCGGFLYDVTSQSDADDDPRGCLPPPLPASRASVSNCAEDQVCLSN
ncbi:MAG: hypothetical protein MJ192_00600 [Clostridia bacterium]|nr:hypothetical protein [Clostridia bacterium]